MSAALFLVALPAHILNFLARNRWFHSVFFNLPTKWSYAEFEQYLMWVLLRVHDGFRKIVSAQSHLTVLILASADFLAVFFLFQNLPKFTMKPLAAAATVTVELVDWENSYFLRNVRPLKLKKCSNKYELSARSNLGEGFHLPTYLFYNICLVLNMNLLPSCV